MTKQICNSCGGEQVCICGEGMYLASPAETPMRRLAVWRCCKDSCGVTLLVSFLSDGKFYKATWLHPIQDN